MSYDEYLATVSEESRQYVDGIMDKIESVLLSNNISFVKNNKGTEIRIEKEVNPLFDKGSLKKLIHESLIIPKPVLSLLIDVKSTNKNIYIRQRKK